MLRDLFPDVVHMDGVGSEVVGQLAVAGGHVATFEQDVE